MKNFRQYSNQEVNDICNKLLIDCLLYIKFEEYPFSIVFEFISNVESKLIKFKCERISTFNLEKNSDETAYYTILEVSSKYVDKKWEIRLLPEIDVTVICENLSIEVIELSKADLKKMGLISEN